MKNLFRNICAFAVMALLTINVNAQIRTPAPSPGSKLTQSVGLTEVTVDYSRPSMKGRTIFAADGLQPYGVTWRTGANLANKFTFSTDVNINGKDLKAGAYTMTSVPGANEWKINLYKYESTNSDAYAEKTADASFMIKPMKLNDMVETFTIDISNITNASATIDLSWEKTKISIPVSVPTDKIVSASIQTVMAGPSANDYYAAASYYLSEKKELDKALEWVKKANSMGEPRFWMMRTEALILAELGKKAEAIKAAEKSIELAKAANNAQYVSMNEASIKEWKK
ncbi:MAG: DUF2911 domain-containing protein [Saprospiraceae bacterium]|nr:DUF2911 domain-containing protein [Saprospiraceae bacterium]